MRHHGPTEPANPPSAAASGPHQPAGVILVYDGASGIGPMLLDVLKKVVGTGQCPLCEITYGALGKRSAWRACEARLDLVVDELHRDQVPAGWGISPNDLPCVLVRGGDDPPRILVSRDEIISCRGRVDALEDKVLANLGRRGRR